MARVIPPITCAPADAWTFALTPIRAKMPAPRGTNLATFTDVYEAWYGHVACWVRSFGIRALDQANVTEAIFVAVHKMPWHLSGSDLAPWLYRLTARQVREYRKRVWIRRVLHRAGASSPAAIESSEKPEVLRQLLMGVREPMRVAFVLSEIEGYTPLEIARIQRMPIETVRLRIDRARRKLVQLVGRSPRRR